MEEAKVNEKEEYARTGEEHNQFEGDTPNPSGPNTLRILYNNCNGLEINELVKSKLKAIQLVVHLILIQILCQKKNS